MVEIKKDKKKKKDDSSSSDDAGTPSFSMVTLIQEKWTALNKAIIINILYI